MLRVCIHELYYSWAVGHLPNGEIPLYGVSRWALLMGKLVFDFRCRSHTQMPNVQAAIYDCVNQPVTPQAPLFFHVCHPLMNALRFSRHFSHLEHTVSPSRMLSCLPHTISHARHVTSNNVTCQLPRNGHTGPPTILSGSYADLLWPCMCVWGRMCGGACLPFHMSSLTHTCCLHHL